MNPRFACKANLTWSPRISSPCSFSASRCALSRGEQRDLQDQTLDVVSGYAASMLAESVSDALGLLDLGIDVREVDFSGGRIGLARHLAPDTRIGVSQELAGEQGQEISIEHQLAPRWNIEASTRTKGSSAIDLFWRWPD